MPVPQIIRPDASTTRNAPTYHGSVPTIKGAATMHGCMTGSLPLHTDYVECEPGSVGDVLVVGLGNPTNTPNNDFNHIIRVCASKNTADGASVGFLCELRQSYVSETDLGTLVAAFSCQNLPSTETFYRYRLTTDQAALITDYTALSCRFTSTNARDGAIRRARLHWCEVELPEPGEVGKHIRLTNEEQRRDKRGLSVTQESDRSTTGGTSPNSQ